MVLLYLLVVVQVGVLLVVLSCVAGLGLASLCGLPFNASTTQVVIGVSNKLRELTAVYTGVAIFGSWVGRR